MPLDTVSHGLEAAERRGLIERDATRVRPTPLGRRFLNDLLQLFLEEVRDAPDRTPPAPQGSETKAKLLK